MIIIDPIFVGWWLIRETFNQMGWDRWITARPMDIYGQSLFWSPSSHSGAMVPWYVQNEIWSMKSQKILKLTGKTQTFKTIIPWTVVYIPWTLSKGCQPFITMALMAVALFMGDVNHCNCYHMPTIYINPKKTPAVPHKLPWNIKSPCRETNAPALLDRSSDPKRCFLEWITLPHQRW